MATMTLQYNARSRVARTRLNEILSWNIFSIVDTKNLPATKKTSDATLMKDLKGALQEVRNHLDGKKEMMKAEDIINEL